jgi:hypothetical protein
MAGTWLDYHSSSLITRLSNNPHSLHTAHIGPPAGETISEQKNNSSDEVLLIWSVRLEINSPDLTIIDFSTVIIINFWKLFIENTLQRMRFTLSVPFFILFNTGSPSPGAHELFPIHGSLAKAFKSPSTPSFLTFNDPRTIYFIIMIYSQSLNSFSLYFFLSLSLFFY